MELCAGVGNGCVRVGSGEKSVVPTVGIYITVGSDKSGEGTTRLNLQTAQMIYNTALAQDPNEKPAAILINPHRLDEHGFSKGKLTGIKMYGFLKIWFTPFMMACGKVQRDGSTLKQVFEGTSIANVSGLNHFVPSGPYGPAASAKRSREQSGVRYM